MGPWSEHGGSYYKCNKYVEPSDTESKDGMLTKEDEERLAKRELDRYLHYYQRYQGHDVGVKYAASTQTAIVEKKMVELQVGCSRSYSYLSHCVLFYSILMYIFLSYTTVLL